MRALAARTLLACVVLSASPVAAQFTYDPAGDLEGTEPGRVDMHVYAPGIRFPIESGPAFANSQIYGHGGYMGPGGGECDGANFAYPWHDNYCETRSWDMPLCPTGMGHQGQDIRAASCTGGVHPTVAVADGTITNIGSYSVYLTTADGTRFDYLHMSHLLVSVGDTVRRGQPIGMVDNQFGGESTTHHLHFNIRQSVSGVGSVYVPPYMSLVQAYATLVGGGEPTMPPVTTGPRLMAEYVHQSFPLSSEPFPLAPGATFAGYIEMRNRGSETWQPGVTFLRTTEPRDAASALAGPDWLSASEPASVDRTVAPGATGRFAFTVQAPASAGDYAQFFGIYHESLGWFGDDGGPIDRWIELRVTVEPVSSTDPDLDGDGAPASRDCDETRADVYPGAPELCGDGVDQNCDGTDEACVVPDGDAGASAGDDAGAPGEADASTTTGGSRGGRVSSGCGCRAAGEPAPWGALWLVALVLVLAARRRRRAAPRATAPRARPASAPGSRRSARRRGLRRARHRNT